MPFQSMNQMKAAFAGGLGPEMQRKAPQWAAETPDLKTLPAHVQKAHYQQLVHHFIKQGLTPHGR